MTEVVQVTHLTLFDIESSPRVKTCSLRPDKLKVESPSQLEPLPPKEPHNIVRVYGVEIGDLSKPIWPCLVNAHSSEYNAIWKNVSRVVDCLALIGAGSGSKATIEMIL